MTGGGGNDLTGSVPPPTASWDFRGGAALRDETGHGLALRPFAGSPSWVPDPELGGALRFDGAADVLGIPAAEVGVLDVARRGDQVTVAALVRRNSPATGFLAGMWQEHDADPRRQYGLFLSLPTYGGDQSVCGHVSGDGLPSPGLPYSRDYAADGREVPLGRWVLAAFDYDGARITARLDGVASPRPHYREPGPPLGESRRYAKNPYRTDAGLNRANVSDFTVGGVKLTAGWGNLLGGDLARIAVWDRALSPDHHRELATGWLPGRGAPMPGLA